MPATVAIASATPELGPPGNSSARPTHTATSDGTTVNAATSAGTRRLAHTTARSPNGPAASCCPNADRSGSESARAAPATEAASSGPSTSATGDAGIARGADQRTADGAPDPDERNGREDDEEADKCGG